MAFHLLIQRRLFLQGGVEIIGFVGALFDAPEPGIHDVPGHHFQGLAVLFVHGKQEEGRHGKDHEQQRKALGQDTPGQEIQRNADHRAAAETEQLPFCEIEEDFGFNFGHVLRYVRLNDVFHRLPP